MPGSMPGIFFCKIAGVLQGIFCTKGQQSAKAGRIWSCGLLHETAVQRRPTGMCSSLHNIKWSFGSKMRINTIVLLQNIQKLQ